MSTFFTRIWLCCTSPSSYKELKEKSFWSGFWYLYWLLVMTTFLSAVTFAVQATVFMPQIKTWIEEAKETVPELFPAELALTLSGGQLSTNVEEPYVFPLPPGWEEAMTQQDEGDYDSEDDNDGTEAPNIQHILVIDTTATIEQFPEYETAVLLTKTAAIARDKNAIKVMLYSEFQKDGVAPITMNREVYTQVSQKALPFLDFIPVIILCMAVAALLLLPWFGAAFGVLGYLLYLLIFTLVSWLIAAIMKRDLSYSALYRLGFYALTPAIIVGWIMERLHVEIPLVFTIVFLVMMGCIAKEFPKKGMPLKSPNNPKPARKTPSRQSSKQ